MSNFEFLRRVNENLYIIAYEAESLFRDEYFEQCITQTRRLAENICRDVMFGRCQPTDSFDDMLATLKDTPAQNDFEKEFLDDLYFLKKAGNTSVHSLTVKQDGNAALDCLQRAFEASLNYAVFKKGLDAKYLQLQFDEELLATGRPGKKNAVLSEKYAEEKSKSKKRTKKEKRKKVFAKKNDNKKLKSSDVKIVDTAKKKKNSIADEDKKPLWREVVETIIAGMIVAVVYFLIFNK
jgi:hypothetical protein